MTSPWIRLAFVLGTACLVGELACGGDDSSPASSTSSVATTGSGAGGAASTTAASSSGSGFTTASSSSGGEGGAPPTVGAPGDETVSAGQVVASPSYKMVMTLGQPSQNQGMSSSPGYRMRGGLVGATQK